MYTLTFQVAVASNVDHRTPVRIASSITSLPPVHLRLDDLSPTLSSASDLRITTFARRSISAVLQTMQHSVEVALRTFGQYSEEQPPPGAAEDH